LATVLLNTVPPENWSDWCNILVGPDVLHRFFQHFGGTAGSVTGTATGPQKPVSLITKSSLLERVDKEDQGGTG